MTMASRAILRRRRSLLDSMNQSTCLIRGFSSFQHGQSSGLNELKKPNLVGCLTNTSDDTDRGHGKGLSSLAGYPTFGYFNRSPCGILNSVGVGRVDLFTPLGARWILQTVQYSSPATAGQRQDDKNELGDSKQQVKEASPEDCDQAVEGLSSAKAKAKAKQIQESQKTAKTILQRVWSMLLGIGPALRAVASMSRFKTLIQVCVCFGFKLLKISDA